jgi:uncharacterized repeat protein (TIGR02543 family)
MDTAIGTIKGRRVTAAGVFLLVVALVAGMGGCAAAPEPEAPLQYELTVSSTEGGSVVSPGEGTFSYDPAEVVNLIAGSAAGYEFVNWTGDVADVASASAAVTTVTMNGDYSITANFGEIPVCQLTVSSTEGGSVTAPGEGTFSYEKGSVVDIVATGDVGYRFVGWVGDVDGVANVQARVTTIAVTGACAIVATFGAEEEVVFADPNLEAAVRDSIHVGERPVYPSDLERLRNLDASYRHIVDLSGLEHCGGSRWLFLVGNQISDISPLAGLTGLTYVDLAGNQISDISPLASLTHLTYLCLGSNQISDISPLAGLTSLTQLQLGGNQISNVYPLASLTGLTSLTLTGNQISDISPLAGLTGLTWLSLGVNQISDISPVDSLTNLTYLYLWSNQISDVSPLVENEGLGTGDFVDLSLNPLNSDSVNTYIPQLRARGVTVNY